MEQSFWRSNRKRECSCRATALLKGKQSLRFAAAERKQSLRFAATERKQSLRFAATGVIQIEFERRDKNKIIYWGGDKK